MKVDSGASENFHEVSHHLPQNATSKSNPFVRVISPNGQTMTYKSTTNLPLPSLSQSLTTSHGFTGLASGYLLSVGQTNNHNCTDIFINCSIKMYNTTDVKIQEKSTNNCWYSKRSLSTPVKCPFTHTTCSATFYQHSSTII